MTRHYTTPMTLAQLLVVQTHDSAIDRLVHSRTTLPEFAVLKMLDDYGVPEEMIAFDDFGG